VSWREGTAGRLASRFAAVRVRPAHRDTGRAQPRAEEWLLVEWPEGEKEPTKYWLATLPEATGLEELVATVKLRWRIERDFEGRGWRGFHHHAALEPVSTSIQGWPDRPGRHPDPHLWPLATGRGQSWTRRSWT
jgi:SRSO17 transposase